MNNNDILFLELLISTIISALLVIFLPKDSQQKNVKQKYIIFYLFFTLLTLIFFINWGLMAIKIYLISALLGTIGEWSIGYYHHRIIGKKLWVYNKNILSGFTSYKSVPLWGFGGLCFSLIFSLVETNL